MDPVSRRGFLGATAGAVGMATINEVGSMAFAAADGLQPVSKPQGIRVGMLTAPFGGDPIEVVLDFAKQAGIRCLEVVAEPGSSHFDPMTFDAARADALKKMLADRGGLEITALSNYMDATEPGKIEEVQTIAKKMIDAAVLLGVPVICMQTGSAAPKMNRINTIKKVLPKVHGPIIAYAAEKNTKIAIENYFETCLQGIDTFECLFETIKEPNFGLNYDPSHLVHQQCNHLKPVTMFADRIFHTHGKDTLVDAEARAHMGVYAHDWWRYVVPGFGNINWGEYISHLRMNNYEGVISIEHEDNTFSREQGFIHGARYLNTFC
ncbi:MAG: sugar phosphate isomerase/epimerase [Candidatus Hydrogenedentes bacterium]|nr:sugar phosphate isomerase/epimerase [Candidatus Hydrogenedentota bacterium]